MNPDESLDFVEWELECDFDDAPTVSVPEDLPFRIGVVLGRLTVYALILAFCLVPWVAIGTVLWVVLR